jgi:RNA polymerase sigma factor (sigma-70 family)
MDETEVLASRFEASRGHLRAVAYRMLGSASEAEDAVQEAWLRLSRADTSGVGNLGGWLTTVVARVCLDTLRSRKARREESMAPDLPERIADPRIDPEQQVVLADAVGQALLVVLETLAPAERVAFVLHDMFDLPFDDIAPIVGRTPTAARQLASRARRRVQGVEPPAARPDRRREIVAAFLAAARGGSFEALLAVLDPDVVVRADAATVQLGAAPEERGAASVARFFSRRARGAQPALVGGEAGLVWAPGGHPRVAFVFTIAGGRIAAVDLVADPEDLARLNLTLLDE